MEEPQIKTEPLVMDDEEVTIEEEAERVIHDMPAYTEFRREHGFINSDEF